jgi:hypothetical protein
VQSSHTGLQDGRCYLAAKLDSAFIVNLIAATG